MASNSADETNDTYSHGDQQRLISIGDVAKMINVTKRTIRRWANDGTIPKPGKFGGVLRWRACDIQNLIDVKCNRESV